MTITFNKPRSNTGELIFIALKGATVGEFNTKSQGFVMFPETPCQTALARRRSPVGVYSEIISETANSFNVSELWLSAMKYIYDNKLGAPILYRNILNRSKR